MVNLYLLDIGILMVLIRLGIGIRRTSIQKVRYLKVDCLVVISSRLVPTST
jgi:hypothetical protein